MLSSILSPANIKSIVDRTKAMLNMSEILASPGGWDQDWSQCYTGPYSTYAQARYDYMVTQLGAINASLTSSAWSIWNTMTCPELPLATRTYITLKNPPGAPGLSLKSCV